MHALPKAAKDGSDAFGTGIFKAFKYDDHGSDEVKYDATETAETANELLLQFNQRLTEFDKRSREIFGIRHQWVKDGERVETPTSIYDFVQASENQTFLKNYF